MSFTRGGYKYSLSSAMSYNGVQIYEVYPGAVNEDKFNRFVLKKLSSIINPYPGDHSVILMDNIQFHHNEIVVSFIAELKAIMVFLPHYMPMLNLMEYGFRDIKAIEISKCVYGEREGLESLISSVEKIRKKDYTLILKQIGFIK